MRSILDGFGLALVVFFSPFHTVIQLMVIWPDVLNGVGTPHKI